MQQPERSVVSPTRKPDVGVRKPDDEPRDKRVEGCSVPSIGTTERVRAGGCSGGGLTLMKGYESVEERGGGPARVS
ncbi:hypothetical protein Trydic_g6609 [Trypoxylus dichotomus]